MKKHALTKSSGRDLTYRIGSGFVGLSILLLLIGAFIIGKVEKASQMNMASFLQFSLETNVAILRLWRQEKINQAEIIVNGPVIQPSLLALLKKTRELNAREAGLMRLPELIALREILAEPLFKCGFMGFVLFDESGWQVGASSDEDLGTNKLARRSDFFHDSRQGKKVLSLPFYENVTELDENGISRSPRPTMFLSLPIKDDDGRIVGVIAFRMDPVADFSQIFQINRSGETGEIYAFSQAGTMLSESRFGDHLRQIGLLNTHRESQSILTVQIRNPGGNMVEGFRPSQGPSAWPLTAMAAQAVKGESGVNTDGYNDYRGVPVVGAWTWLPDFKFGVTSEIDVTEAYKPVIMLKFWFWILFILTLSIFLILVWLFFKKRTADELVRSTETRYKSIVDSAHDAIITIDECCRIKSYNPAAQRMFGYAWENVREKNISLLLAPSGSGSLEPPLNSVAPWVQQAGAEGKGRRHDGTTFPLDIAIGEMEVDARPMVTCILRDVSERHQAEQSLRDREVRLSAILNNILDGIITIDDHGIIEGINPAAQRIFGYTDVEVIGSKINLLMPNPYRDEHDGYMKNYRETRKAKIIGIGREVEGLRRDGSIFPMELAVAEMEVGGKRMFTGAIRDITERKQIEKVKQEFVSTVSHELRTPLTSIKGSLGLIKSGVLNESPDKLSSMLDIAYNNCERLVRLINDILDIDKIASGKMRFQMTPLDLGQILDQAYEANKGYGEPRGVTFLLHSTLKTAMVKGDPDRLMQVLANLLSNAVKFSPDGGKVELSLSAHDSGFRVAVRDHGPGISEAFRDRIFDKFAQADSSDARRKGGTGLGLNISKIIIEHHGGTIGFTTEVGKGATFYFDLPRHRNSELDTAAVTTDRLSNGRVLICEDDADIAKLLEMILEQDGFTADKATNANAALSLLKQHAYDAMTLDLALPDKDGITLIRELRLRPETMNLPIIVISATAQKNAIEFAGELSGVVDWHQKPIDHDQLSASLRYAMSLTSGNTAKILHVEDDPDILKIIADLVGDQAQITPAMNLAAGCALLQQSVFDLVILDLILPDGRGEELLSSMRSGINNATPVILFSAVAEGSEKIGKNNLVTLVKSKATNADLTMMIHAAIAKKKARKISPADTPHACRRNT